MDRVVHHDGTFSVFLYINHAKRSNKLSVYIAYFWMTATMLLFSVNT